MIHLPDAPDVVFLGGVTGETWIESSDVDMHRAQFEALSQLSLSPDDSVAMIERAAQES